MATLYSTNKTIERSITPSTILDPGVSGGNVRCFIDTYVGLGTEASGDVIQIGPVLPVGARILWGYVTTTNIGGTPDLGDYEDTDRYLDEITDTSTTTMFNDVITGAGYKVDMTTASTPDNQMIITLDAAVTAAGIIKLVVFYTVE